ncbi:helix-turn-helix transcriptional regulator [Actinoallomurus purpureus]|uniref:helix-turn-helix domain-containing protein n=1 Tax=Actinoallomurus purpureus TaxID=478114 RepID=UPI0020934F1E|nr:helix-turn-helix transcriptional regulator [Actinoallomurus purpureus]MCO6006843.1 helix-turn-helix transcriptional regulator [Actinoallomurus purpureus]
MPRRPNPLDPSSSPLALFGSELRFLRERAALSQDQVGAKANYSGSHIGSIERAEDMPLRDFAVKMDKVLNGNGILPRLWDGLLKRSVHPPWFDWPIHEAAADLLRSFHLAVVDGLLQTEAYARVLLHGDEQAVRARMARQELLRRTEPDPPYLVSVLDESVLWRDIGGPEVMREQLQHLVSVVSERISVHVLPCGLHRGINGSFILATLEDRREVAYEEAAARGITTGEPKVLATLTERFESIRSRALPVDQSLDLIMRTAKQRWS